MLYCVVLDVPANTPEDAPVEKTVAIEGPGWSRVKVHVTDGCMGLVRVAIYYGAMQLWPSKEGEWLSGNDIIVEDEVWIRLPESPTRLRILGASPGTHYDHPVFFYLQGLPEENVPNWVVLTDIKALLEFALGVTR